MSPAPPWSPQAFRILVVEDDESDLELLRFAIERNDVQAKVVPAFTGRAALELLAAGQLPDVIILDLRLPDMDGIEVLTRLKQDPRLAGIPVIILSNSTDPRDVEEGYRHHAAAYLQKPTSEDSWQQLVRSFTDYWLKVVLLPKS